ncbi:MAG: hypothetical protein ABJA87_03720 [bacterium]
MIAILAGGLFLLAFGTFGPGNLQLQAAGVAVFVAALLLQVGVQRWMKRTTTGPQQFDIDRRTVRQLQDLTGLYHQLRHLAALSDPFTEPL